jgi:hypothetical protein
MQLLAIILYNALGEQRIIQFRPGALNVVTGISATGKSALLDIVDFCMGRSTVTMAVGPITDRVVWYAVLVQLPGGRAFIARPTARPGRASTQVAMLELGGDLSPLPFERLEVNADIRTVREQLGRLLGIDENEHDLPTGSLTDGLEANLGHAMLLCLQGQGEIANRDLLFHRQGEPGIADAIRATLPYFLGAVPRNQGALRQRLLEARRQQRRAQDELQRARLVDEDVDVQLRGLTTEAVALGLMSETIEGRVELSQALGEVLQGSVPEPVADDELAVERSRLTSQRAELRGQLRAIGEQIALLDEIESDGNEYGTAVAQQVSRLRSIDLLATNGEGDNSCPVCGSHLSESDPSVEDLRRDADELQSQLRAMGVAVPARRAALERLQSEADMLRQRLRGIDAALDGLAAGQDAIGDDRRASEQQAFFRGRLQQYISTSRAADSAVLQELEDRVRVRALAVADLEAQINPDDERDQVESRLAVVGADMTSWADRLQLEHQVNVRLDLRRLTIVTDTSSGPAPLFRIGSAENWVSYHLLSHLALHRYFTREDRPVPHFLMLDQPTQAYYPSDMERERGVPRMDQDREAVRRLYELMRDVTVELAPSMQVIACDHANLPEDWFQEAVVENWRDGEKLVPESWTVVQGDAGTTPQ